MTRSACIIVIACAALGLGLAGCSGESTAPGGASTSDVRADVAFAAGEATAQDVEVMNESESAAAPPTTTRIAASVVRELGGWPPDACTENADTHVWSCARTTWNGLSLERTYAFFGGGAPQDVYSATATDSVRLTSHLFGSLSNAAGDWTAEIDRSRSFTLSGLTGTETSRTWNGTGSADESVQLSDSVGSRSYHWTVSSEYRNVVVMLPRVEHPWPSSGTIVRAVNGTYTRIGGATVTRTVSFTATITFNGTALVPVDVGTTTRYCFDLATRRRLPVSACPGS